MKLFTILLSLFLTVVVVTTDTMSQGIPDKASVNDPLGAMARVRASAARSIAKNQDPTSLMAALDPCEEGQFIIIGQTVGGAINNTDCQLEDGPYADFFVFEGKKDQQVTLQMYSSSIDSYLALANESGSFLVQDDDSGGGWTARINATLPEDGFYAILSTTAYLNSFGGYTLTISGAEPCSYSVSPTTIEIPASGGEFSFAVNTQPECHWQAQSVNNYLSTTSTGVGPGTVTFTATQNGSGSTRNASLRVSSAPLFTVDTYFNISQPSVACSYSLSAPSARVGAFPSSGSFSIIAPAGCPWSVQSGSWVTASGSGMGSATINYSMPHNNGADRTDAIRIADLTFTINQTGLNCTYAFSPSPFYIGRSGGSGSVDLMTQPGCTWFATTNMPWVGMQPQSGSGPVTIPFAISANPENGDRSAAIQLSAGGVGTPILFIEQSRFSNRVATVAGRVTGPDGRGMQNTVVAIVDPWGFTQRVTTSSFGYYSFSSVTAGYQYTLRVVSKRYKFANKTMSITDSLADLNFLGVE